MLKNKFSTFLLILLLLLASCSDTVTPTQVSEVVSPSIAANRLVPPTATASPTPLIFIDTPPPPNTPTSKPNTLANTPTLVSTVKPTIANTPTLVPTTSVIEFSGEKALAHARELVVTVGVRAAGTDGERKAADYIQNYFQSLGLVTTRPIFDFTSYDDRGSNLTYQDVTLKGNGVNASSAGKASGIIADTGLARNGSVAANSLLGKLALIERGELTFSEKVANVTTGGAIGVIIYNNQDGPLNNIALQNKAGIPVFALSKADGEKVKAAIGANPNLRATLNVDISSKTGTSQNIVGQRVANVANAPIMVIGGHYDSVPTGPGANDNASGTAATLELARVLQKQYPQFEMRFIAFGGEEVGLLGSSDYVKKLSAAEKSRVLVMINLDMVSYGPDFLAGGDDELVRLALAAATNEGAGNIKLLPAIFNAASDHFPFAQAGIKVLFLNRGDDPDYHMPTDTLNKLQPERLALTGRVVVKVLETFVKVK